MSHNAADLYARVREMIPNGPPVMVFGRCRVQLEPITCVIPMVLTDLGYRGAFILVS